MRPTVMLLVAGLLIAADVKDDEAKTKQEVAKFTGTWVMLERNDKKPANRKWVFTTDKITDHSGDKTREGTFRVDPAKKHIDLVGKTATLVGIYEFLDDNKKLKVSGAEVPDGKDKETVRPKDFVLKKGQIVYVLERGK